MKHIYPYKNECESTSERPKQPQEESTENTLPRDNQRRSTHQLKHTSLRQDFVAPLLGNEPQTFKLAISSSESTYWKEAISS